MFMLIIDTIITEMIMTDVRTTITEIDVMTHLVAVVAAVMTTVAVIYVLYLYVIHAVNAVEEIYVLVSRR